MTSTDPRAELIFEFMDEDLSKMLRRVKHIAQSTVKVTL
jgi:hypothetical protein